MHKTTAAPETLQAAHCPAWCDKDHAQDLVDGATSEQARKHEIGGTGAILHEMRNTLSGQVVRRGGGVWNVGVSQDTFINDADGRHGICPATVDLQVDDLLEHTHAKAALTAGEALELAAVLTHYAHKITLI